MKISQKPPETPENGPNMGFSGMAPWTVIQATFCSLFLPKLTKYWRERGILCFYPFFTLCIGSI